MVANGVGAEADADVCALRQNRGWLRSQGFFFPGSAPAQGGVALQLTAKIDCTGRESIGRERLF